MKQSQNKTTKLCKSAVLSQNRENNYDDGRKTITQPTSCALCCCDSCTGFACPWVKRKTTYTPDWVQLVGKANRRCAICLTNADLKRIYDCDFYTYFKRKRFYLPRTFRRKKKKTDEICEKLDKIIQKLDSAK